MSLTAQGVSIKFGGLAALSNVDISVEPGQILGLVGPNGAGKSTLFNCVTGVVKPDAGSVSLDGEDLSDLRLDQRIRRGIGRTFQTPRLDLAGSVLDGVMLGFYPRTQQSILSAFLPLKSAAIAEAEHRHKALALIRQFDLCDDPETPLGKLSLGHLRLLEVARAMAGEPKYLLLDEPAAGIDGRDRERLAAAIRGAARRGFGVLIVEHNVAFVADLSDRMVALVAGRVIAQGIPADVTSDPVVVQAYLGVPHAA
jgi:ABC-type branched-subunit amino acid transport system ATPase component